MGLTLVKGMYLEGAQVGGNHLMCVCVSLPLFLSPTSPSLLVSDKQWKKYPQVRINKK